jgi:hypothetical protein
LQSLTFVLRRYYVSDAHVRGPVSEEEVLSEQDPEAVGEGKAEAPCPSESDVEEGSDSEA